MIGPSARPPARTGHDAHAAQHPEGAAIRNQSSGPFDDLSQHVRSMLDALSGDEFFRSHAQGGWRPRVNIYEVSARYYICVDLAGMPLADISLHVEQGKLQLSGSRPKPALPAGETDIGVHMMEIDSGPFERSLGLPRDVALDAVRARYRDGLLWIELPRRPAGGAEDE